MPDIVHVITDKSIGGAGILLSELLDASDTSTGSLVLLPTGSPLYTRLSARGISCAFFPLARERSFSLPSLRAIYAILAERRPALVVSHASFSARAAAGMLGIPAISVRHCDTPVSKRTLPLYNALTRATVATSHPQAEHLKAAGVKGVLTIENGYTPIGRASEAEKAAARARLGFPRDTLLLGIVGRPSPIKGQATAIRALARLGKKGDGMLLALLGDGEARKELKTLAAALGVGERVRLLGYREDVHTFYHAIDVHLSTSLGSETSSLALAEGMSAGCPTLATDTPGNRMRVGDGGLLFPVGDEEALSALFLYARRRDVRMRLSLLAEERARLLPTWEETRARYRALFGAFCGELAANGCNLQKDMLS